MAVCHQRRRIVGLGLWCGGRKEGRERQEVAAAAWAGGDEGEDLGYQSLLYCCVLGEVLAAMRQMEGRAHEWFGAYQLGVEFSQPWLAIVVEHQDGVDHYCTRLGCRIFVVMTS